MRGSIDIEGDFYAVAVQPPWPVRVRNNRFKEYVDSLAFSPVSFLCVCVCVCVYVDLQSFGFIGCFRLANWFSRIWVGHKT